MLVVASPRCDEVGEWIDKIDVLAQQSRYCVVECPKERLAILAVGVMRQVGLEERFHGPHRRDEVDEAPLYPDIADAARLQPRSHGIDHFRVGFSMLLYLLPAKMTAAEVRMVRVTGPAEEFGLEGFDPWLLEHNGHGDRFERLCVAAEDPSWWQALRLLEDYRTGRVDGCNGQSKQDQRKPAPHRRVEARSGVVTSGRRN